MNTFFSLLGSSIGGSVELLTLCAAGALLSYLGHWNGTISAALSNGVYKVFFPALAFGPVLDTVHANLGAANASSADVWVPLAASVAISFIACLVAYPVTVVVARGKDELVKRAIFMCLVLGNSNTMALLIMQSLCESYAPFMQVPKCSTTSTTYSTLYILPVTVLTWTFVFPYILRTPHEPENGPLLYSPQQESPPVKYSLLQGVRDSILCPPTVTVLVAALLSFIPRVAEMFLNDHGVLHPVLMSTNLVGTVAVPMSSVIVGAELYESLTEEDHNTCSSKTFGNAAIAAISVVRFIVLPLIGRLVHRLLGLSKLFGALLGAFVLTEWSVTSANNTIIMASIIAEMVPGRGERLRRDVAKCLFVQYVVAPVFVTINTALALAMTFE